jgi:hypothetical protein
MELWIEFVFELEDMVICTIRRLGRGAGYQVHDGKNCCQKWFDPY